MAARMGVAAAALAASDVAYDNVIVGCGNAGTAALRAVVAGAKPGQRTLVLESDAAAHARCARIATRSGAHCARARAAWLDPALKTVTTRGGDVFRYDGRALVAAGAAPPIPPAGFVDARSRARVRCLGLGEARDAAVTAEAAAVARGGGAVVVVGGCARAVEIAAAVAGAGGRRSDGDEAVALVCPEAGPIGARLPRALGARLGKRLARRGVAVVPYHQVRYVGPGEAARARVYLGRVDDALATRSRAADLVVVAGGEYYGGDVPVRAADALSAARGARRLGAGPVAFDDLARRPLAVDASLSAGLGGVLAAGDAAATPWRLESCTAAPAACEAYGLRAYDVALTAGDAHAAATGAAAGAALAGGGAASVGALTPAARVALGEALGASLGFVGRADAALEHHVFSVGEAAVAVFVDRRRRARRPVGVALYLDDDASCDRGVDAAAALLRTAADAPPDDDEAAHPDVIYARDIARLRAFAEAVGDAAGVRGRLRRAPVISRADRLGPKLHELIVPDAAVWSRGKNGHGALKRAYSAAIVGGPAVAPSEAERIQAAAAARRPEAGSRPEERPPDWRDLADARAADLV